MTRFERRIERWVQTSRGRRMIRIEIQVYRVLGWILGWITLPALWKEDL